MNNTIIKKIFIAVIFLVSLFSIATVSQAALDCKSQGLTEKNGICVPESPFGSSGLAGATTAGGAIKLVITALLTLSGVVALIFIIYGGFLYMTAGGNDAQAKKGKMALFYAIGGLAVIILAYALINVLTNALTSNNPTGL